MLFTITIRRNGKVVHRDILKNTMTAEGLEHMARHASRPAATVLSFALIEGGGTDWNNDDLNAVWTMNELTEFEDYTVDGDATQRLDFTTNTGSAKLAEKDIDNSDASKAIWSRQFDSQDPAVVTAAGSIEGFVVLTSYIQGASGDVIAAVKYDNPRNLQIGDQVSISHLVKIRADFDAVDLNYVVEPAGTLTVTSAQCRLYDTNGPKTLLQTRTPTVVIPGQGKEALLRGLFSQSITSTSVGVIDIPEDWTPLVTDTYDNKAWNFGQFDLNVSRTLGAASGTNPYTVTITTILGDFSFIQPGGESIYGVALVKTGMAGGRKLFLLLDFEANPWTRPANSHHIEIDVTLQVTV